MFFDEGVFSIVSDIAEKGNFDIVEFKGAERYKFNVFSTKFRDSEYSFHVNNLILYQPELGQYARRKNNKFGVFDCFLWGKCIKANIYKKTINSMGEEVYANKIIWGEDLITSFVLFRIAESFKFIYKYGISRYKISSTSSNHTPRQNYYLAKIIYLKILLKFTKDNFFDKKYLVYETLQFFKFKEYLNNETTIIFDKTLENILENKYN